MSLHQSLVHSIITGGPVNHAGYEAEFVPQDGSGFLDFAKNLYGKAKSFVTNKVIPFFNKHKATVLNKIGDAAKNAFRIGLKSEGSLKDRLKAAGNSIKNDTLQELSNAKKGILNRLERERMANMPETIITV